RRQARIAEIALKVGTSLSHSGSIVETLQMLVEAARGILGARCARIGTTLARSPAQPLHLLAFEHLGLEWPEALQDWETRACSIVEMSNRPMRQPHSIPGRDGASDRAGASVPPPKASWLGVPLVGNDGRNLGVLQFLDKSDHGDFSVEDEAIGVQVATMAAVALETWRLVQALKQADRQKDAFLATLAHELRNPLAPLRNGLEIIRKAPAGSDVSRTREMMDRQLRQMVRLIDDLLDLGRITQGKIDLRRERIEISAVVQLALESCMTTIEQAGHRLHVAQTPDRIFVDVDVTRFAQVFANLLNNAAKFTPPGGEIHVAIGRDGEDAFVSVKDTGVGIPEDMLASVFDMFTQVERTLDRTHGGLGIGLYLVRRLTEMHGGSVAARSAGPDQGSEFVIRVPVLLSLVPDSHAPAPVDHPSSPGRRRILIADDNADAAESLAMLLQMQGDDVRTVRDGIEALKLGESFRPHVVLLDIGMPRLNGIDTARRARVTDWGRDALLVAITGWGQPGDRERSEAAGFDLHLVKPVDIDALLDGLANDKRNSGG
ncbi:MAG: ATP-binding protein, partial [Betaproteobacteria bacterium]